ncbi:MAG: hypothetical protein JRH15_07585 [Deltaproteobacteria bacterium]|nr:hypothetical protein [Deltaproteobacteria bacterium]
MKPDQDQTPIIRQTPVLITSAVLIGLGGIVFVTQAMGAHPERVWMAYLINFLLWSAISQGGLLFSAVMHITRARWSASMAGVAEAFSAFFPISLILFLVLLLGKTYLFPWIGQDLHGKEVWLNTGFLFTRDALGLLVLYALGGAYLYYALGFKLSDHPPDNGLRRWFYRVWNRHEPDMEKRSARMTFFSILYILAFVVVLSLIGYDWVMAADPHWYSTLFGAYTFVKAFYVGLGGIIILASFLKLKSPSAVPLADAHFHDVGKLFLGFCLVWADFFYCQFLVIWYGNIPEESAYIIERTLRDPYRVVAWTVFAISFLLPFFILLNRRIKMMPRAMTLLCTVVIAGIWLEHLLLLAPALQPHAESVSVGLTEAAVTLGFFGLMLAAVTLFLNRFPELVMTGSRSVMED